MSFDVEAIWRDFPILICRVGEHPPVYLDSANTSQKPWVVADATTEHYFQYNANVARVMYVLSAEAIETYEGARGLVVSFIGTTAPKRVIFTRSAPGTLNLTINTLTARPIPGDEVVISMTEYHSNIVPWQLVCERTGAVLRWFDVTDEGRLNSEAIERNGSINEHTGVVSAAHVSNMPGTHNPVTEIAVKVHAVGVVMAVDVSQSVFYRSINVAELGAGLVVFTGHKMCGPTGIGVLQGRGELLEPLPPFPGGRGMVEVAEVTHPTYADPPHRFEAGTPPIVWAVGFGVIIRHLQGVEVNVITVHEHEPAEHIFTKLASIDGLLLLGPVGVVERGSTCLFNLKSIHPHDVIQVLDSRGITIRDGYHRARSLHRRLGHQNPTRASAHLHTTREGIDTLADALVLTRDYFGVR